MNRKRLYLVAVALGALFVSPGAPTESEASSWDCWDTETATFESSVCMTWGQDVNWTAATTLTSVIVNGPSDRCQADVTCEDGSVETCWSNSQCRAVARNIGSASDYRFVRCDAPPFGPSVAVCD